MIRARSILEIPSMHTSRREMLLDSTAVGLSLLLSHRVFAHPRVLAFRDPSEAPIAGGEDDIPVPKPSVARFESLGYGLFLHFGLYSQLGRGEWVKHIDKIPTDEYFRRMKTFEAREFSGRALARVARTAGMRYITLTSRHHDGFSLYDTRGLSVYDVTHTPAGRDLILDFVEGCRAEGIVPFLYHTTLDWTDPRFESDFKGYLQYLRESVEILCTSYGPIGGFWFDGKWSRKDADWEEDALYAVIRRHQPEAIIVNNTGLEHRGRTGHPEIDSVTFERGTPTPMDRRGMKKYLSAEMCETMNFHWGAAFNDFNYLSPAHVIEELCACREVGANYLLNIGPSPQGALPDYESAAVRRAGEWLKMHEEAIYLGRPCRLRGQGRDFALRTPNATYCFILDLTHTAATKVQQGARGPGPRHFSGADRPIKSAVWTDNEERAVRSERRGPGPQHLEIPGGDEHGGSSCKAGRCFMMADPRRIDDVRGFPP